MKKTAFKIHPAVIAVWSALVAAGHLLPTIPIWGTGAVFSLEKALSPLSGIFFGPIYGALSSAVGGFLGSLIAPQTAWMGIGTFTVSMTTAFTSGCIAWGKLPPVAVSGNGSFIFNGGIIVYLIGTVLWFTQEIGRSVIIFPVVFYGLGFTAMMVSFFFAGRMFASPKNFWKFPAIWLCSFSGLIAGAAVGNFFSLALTERPREFWLALTIAAPIERVVFALGAAIVGVPLLSGLNKTGIFAGPQFDEEEAAQEKENG